MIKTFLRDIPQNLLFSLIDKFPSFSLLLDGNTIVFFEVNNNSNELSNLNIDNIVAFSALQKTPEYFLLEDIKLASTDNSKNIINNLFSNIVLSVAEQDMPLMINSFTKKEKKLFNNSLEFLSKKYGVYVMDEKEYLEIKNN